MSEDRPRRRATTALALVLLASVTVLALEVVCRVAERVPQVQASLRPAARKALLDEQTRRLTRLLTDSLGDNVLRLDPELGWRYGAGGVGDTITVGANGQRGIGFKTVDDRLPRHVIGAWGDSFVFCSEVKDTDCWLSRWQARNADVQVRNFGVGGYGADQALLRFRRTVDSFPVSTAILGFTDDDLRRLVSVYRRFVDNDEYPLLKPRFRLDEGSLVLEPNPGQDSAFLRKLLTDPLAIRSAGHRDLHYNRLLYASSLTDHSALVRLLAAVAQRVWLRYLSPGRIWDARGVMRPGSEAFSIQLAVFQAFAAEANAKGAVPIILLLPGKASVDAVATSRPYPLQPLVDSLKARRLPFVDAASALARAARAGGSQRLFAPGGHYSPAGNDAIAGVVDSLFQAGALSRNAHERETAPASRTSPP
jgi:hypothetical protein